MGRLNNQLHGGSMGRLHNQLRGGSMGRRGKEKLGGSCGTPSRRKLDLMFHVAEYVCIDGVADTYPWST